MNINIECPFNSEQIITESTNAQYSKILNQYPIDLKLTYSAYGYALKSVFLDMISLIMYLRSRQFKQKQKQINNCRENLNMLFSFLENKKKKSNYLSLKLKNFPRKRQLATFTKQGQKNLSNTFSTQYSLSMNNNTEQSLFANQNDIEQNRQIKSGTQQSNESIQKIMNSSIKNINCLLDVMSILIQKDERQGLPNFIEIVTNIKNQVKIGNVFFEQELYKSDQTIQFVHPELVKEVTLTLPQFQLNKKIDYLKFKAARNIIFNENQMTQLDLKSLDLNKLSSIIGLNQIPQLRTIFLGNPKDFTSPRIHFYVEFLSICLSKLISKINYFCLLKQKNFILLNNQSKSGSSRTASSNRLNMQKIIISNQHLQQNQQETATFYLQIKQVFQSIVKSLITIKGPQYYVSQKYLERTIQILIENFGLQEILVQQMESILRNANLIDKINFLEKSRKKYLSIIGTRQKPILNIIKQKSFSCTEKSTFFCLAQRKSQKLDIRQQTSDSLRTNSTRN